MNWINRLVELYNAGEITPIGVVESLIGIGLIIFLVYLGARTYRDDGYRW